jgi:hypothetical protein
MRQHAIPQNILDIEFKLFTKFTVREFVYMAIGIGFGGIFLYFFTLGQIPGIIAFPVFLISSGLGLFLGLVDINDQKADVFIRNYAWAITHPTQRVWKNSMIDEKFENIKPELNVTQGTTSRDTTPEAGTAEIIGGTSDLPSTQFIEPATLNEIDLEEQKELDRIDKLARDTFGSSQSTQVQQQTPQPQVVPEPVIPVVTNIRIDRNSISQYLTELAQPGPYAGNMNFKVLNSQDAPVQGVVLVVKDEQGRVISALQSDANGEVIANKFYPQGTYSLQLLSNSYKFPDIQILLDQEQLQPIKIKAI